MSGQKETTKMVNVGKYLALIDIVSITNEYYWSPYLSVEDTFKLDDVRTALQNGDLTRAARFARIFELMPDAA